MRSINNPPINRPATAPIVNNPIAHAASAGPMPAPFKCNSQCAVKKKKGNWHAMPPTTIIQNERVANACLGVHGNAVTKFLFEAPVSAAVVSAPPSISCPKSSGLSLTSRNATIADVTATPITIVQPCLQFPPFTVKIRFVSGDPKNPANPEALSATAIVLPRYLLNHRVIAVATGTIVPKLIPVPIKTPNPSKYCQGCVATTAIHAAPSKITADPIANVRRIPHSVIEAPTA